MQLDKNRPQKMEVSCGHGTLFGVPGMGCSGIFGVPLNQALNPQPYVRKPLFEGVPILTRLITDRCVVDTLHIL